MIEQSGLNTHIELPPCCEIDVKELFGAMCLGTERLSESQARVMVTSPTFAGILQPEAILMENSWGGDMQDEDRA
jgi:hypothetical protein